MTGIARISSQNAENGIHRLDYFLPSTEEFVFTRRINNLLDYCSVRLLLSKSYPKGIFLSYYCNSRYLLSLRQFDFAPGSHLSS